MRSLVSAYRKTQRLPIDIVLIRSSFWFRVLSRAESKAFILLCLKPSAIFYVLIRLGKAKND
jgi:hypothetical protein